MCFNVIFITKLYKHKALCLALKIKTFRLWPKCFCLYSIKRFLCLFLMKLLESRVIQTDVWCVLTCSVVWLFVIPWIPVAWQVPLSVGFSRQEYWSELPCPPPGNLPNPEIKLTSLTSPSLAGRFFTTSHLSFLRPHFFQTPKKGINSFLWKKFLSYLQVCGFAYDFNRLSFSWRRQWHPTPVFLPGKSHGQRSLVGCSLWCH